MTFYIQKVKREPPTSKIFFSHLRVLSESAVRAKQADECKGFDRVCFSQWTDTAVAHTKPIGFAVTELQVIVVASCDKTLCQSSILFCTNCLSMRPRHVCMCVPSNHEANQVAVTLVTNVSGIVNDVFFPLKQNPKKVIISRWLSIYWAYKHIWILIGFTFLYLNNPITPAYLRHFGQVNDKIIVYWFTCFTHSLYSDHFPDLLHSVTQRCIINICRFGCITGKIMKNQCCADIHSSEWCRVFTAVKTHHP